MRAGISVYFTHSRVPSSPPRGGPASWRPLLCVHIPQCAPVRLPPEDATEPGPERGSAWSARAPSPLLEAAEHLAYCDPCLQRYTDLLSGAELLTPERSCQKSLWRRIRQRTLHILTSRYATAVAGVVLMITLLWGSSSPAFQRLPEELPAISQKFQAWPQRWNEALDSALSGLSGIFDQIGGIPYEP